MYILVKFFEKVFTINDINFSLISFIYEELRCIDCDEKVYFFKERHRFKSFDLTVIYIFLVVSTIFCLCLTLFVCMFRHVYVNNKKGKSQEK